MASPLGSVLRYVERLVGLPQAGDFSDGQLLDRYVSGRDESALATLMQRHGPLVWSVCQRLLPDSHDAEDAFQATFIVLTRKAASLERRPSLAAWLYEVAQRTALQARSLAARRRQREQQSPPRAAPEDHDVVDRDELRAALDIELSKLPERYRAPVVLCDLQGKTHVEAAHELNMPSGSVSKRLARGRELLRERLVRRGLTVSAATLPALLGEQAARAAVPLHLIQSTREILNGAPLPAGTQASLLAEGVLRTMHFSKLKIVVVLLIAGSLTLAAGYAMQEVFRTPEPALLAYVPVPESMNRPEPRSSEPVIKDGLSVTVTPVKAAFALDEPPAFKVEFKNVSNKPFQIYPADVHELWKFVFTDRQGTTYIADERPQFLKPPPQWKSAGPHTLQPGKSLNSFAKLLLKDLKLERVGPEGATSLEMLPPGDYRIKIELSLAEEEPGALPYWKGALITKEAAFTVTKEIAPAPRPSEPAVKDGLSVSVTPMKAVFARNEPPTFRVEFLNVSNKAYLVFPADLFQGWKYTFVDLHRNEYQAAASWRKPPTSNGPHTIEPGKALTTIAIVGTSPGVTFHFGGPDPVKLDGLGPGFYRATIKIDLDQPPGQKFWPLPFWKGTIETRPVAFMISDKELPVDEALAAKATLIVRGKRLRTISTPRQPCDEVDVVEVVRDSTKKGKKGTLRAFRGEFAPAIPDKLCTVYLVEGTGNDWSLIGVSHTVGDKKESR
ncbi:MAG: RNA polymerase sigma factor [Gemmataceae bacterium]